MSPIKDTLSNLFSKNKKKDDGFSPEIENEHGTTEETDHDADITDGDINDGDEKQDTESENETVVQDDLEADPEWKNRVLCNDGNCIGVIGPDGRCKECGKPYNETEQIYDNEDNETEIYDRAPDEGLISEEQDFFPLDPEELNDTSGESGTEKDAEPGSEWDKRMLCIDGNCIGVIGPDGHCKECGKPYEK
jgi:hypothetical protein